MARKSGPFRSATFFILPIPASTGTQRSLRFRTPGTSTCIVWTIRIFSSPRIWASILLTTPDATGIARQFQDVAGAGRSLVASLQKHGLIASFDAGTSWQRVSDPVAEGFFPVVQARRNGAVVA